MSAQTIAALQDAFWQFCDALLYHRTNPWELDEALTEWGYDMGPCEAQDLVGLEKVLARAPDRPSPVLARMVAEGRMGKSGGVGYYRYPGGNGAVIDPLIEDLILEEAWFGKISRSEWSNGELLHALHAALRPVCQQLIAEGMKSDALFELLTTALHFPNKQSSFEELMAH